MAIASHPDVIIYTTPDCPDCRALKAWLKIEGSRPTNATSPTPISWPNPRARWRPVSATDAVARDCLILTAGKLTSPSQHRWSKRLCRSVRHAGCGPRTFMPMCSLPPTKRRRVANRAAFRLACDESSRRKE